MLLSSSICCKSIHSKYVDSLKLFFILVPTIALTSSITIIKQNYYKSLNKNIRFFVLGVIAILLMLFLILGFFFLVEKNVIMVASGYEVGVLLWFMILELDLEKFWVLNYQNQVFI